MSEKKELGFDILENTDDKTVERLEKDMPMVSESDRERMLNMSIKKFEKEMDIPENKSFSGNVVSGVETYKKPRISKMMTALTGIAASVAIVGSCVWIASRNGGGIIREPEHKTGVIETTTEAEDNTTETTTETTTTPAFEDFTESVAADYNDAAEQLIKNEYINAPEYYFDIEYSFIEVNHDDVPELLVAYTPNGDRTNTLYSFDGSKYTVATYSADEDLLMNAGMIFDLCGYNADEGLIYLEHKSGYNVIELLKVNRSGGFTLSDTMLNADGSLADYESFKSERVDSYTWTEPEFTLAAEHSAAAEHDIIGDQVPAAADRLISEKYLSAGDIYSNVEYAYVDVNGDKMPELSVSATYPTGANYSDFYYYNGSDYVPVEFTETYEGEEYNVPVHGNLQFCYEEHLIWNSKPEGSGIDVIKMNDDNTFEIIKTFGYDSESEEYYNSKTWEAPVYPVN